MISFAELDNSCLYLSTKLTIWSYLKRGAIIRLKSSGQKVLSNYRKFPTFSVNEFMSGNALRQYKSSFWLRLAY